MDVNELAELYNGLKHEGKTTKEIEEITGIKAKTIMQKLSRNGFKAVEGIYILQNAEKKVSPIKNRKAMHNIVPNEKKEKYIYLSNKNEDVTQVSFKYYDDVLKKYDILCSHYTFYRRQDIISFLLEKGIEQYWTEEMQKELEENN